MFKGMRNQVVIEALAQRIVGRKHGGKKRENRE